MEDQMKIINELQSRITCALTHDMRVCETCKLCEGKDFAEIRINLVKKLENTFDGCKEILEFFDKTGLSIENKQDVEKFEDVLLKKLFDEIKKIINPQTAEEMFKELGYILTRPYFNDQNYLRYLKKVSSNDGSAWVNHYVEFDPEDMHVLCGCEGFAKNMKLWEHEEIIDIKLHKAITKQMEELGWIFYD